MGRWTLAVVAGLAVVALGVGAYILGYALGEPPLHGTELDPAPPVADIELVAAGGKSIALSEFLGKHVVLFFGYSTCPDVCPLTMARLGSAYRALGEPEEIQVLMVTVDPENDSPAVINDYARRFHPAFVGLSGSSDAIDAAADRFYIGHRADGAGEVIHGSQVLLVDPEGRFWRVYNDEAQHYLEGDLRRVLGDRSL